MRIVRGLGIAMTVGFFLGAVAGFAGFAPLSGAPAGLLLVLTLGFAAALYISYRRRLVADEQSITVYEIFGTRSIARKDLTAVYVAEGQRGLPIVCFLGHYWRPLVITLDGYNPVALQHFCNYLGLPLRGDRHVALSEMLKHDSASGGLTAS